MSLPLKNMVLPLNNLVKIKTSPPEDSIFFYSTPKEILSFYNLPLGNSMVPQPERYRLTVQDPDLQIRGEGRGRSSRPWDKGGGGGRPQKKFFSPLGPQFGVTIRGKEGLGPPGPFPGPATILIITSLKSYMRQVAVILLYPALGKSVSIRSHRP